jgi:hypothetical protein
LRSVKGKGGRLVVPLLLFATEILFCKVDAWVVELLRGRIDVRLELAESGEGPCALVRAQERMRSRND